MKLNDFSPRWSYEIGGKFLSFNCPCGCKDRIDIPVDCDLQGKGWKSDALDFDLVSITPSIQRMAGCLWHGWITKGEVLTCKDG